MIRSWRKEGRRLFRIFDAYAAVSLLALNLHKTYGIPLWLEEAAQIQHRLQGTSFPQIQWAHRGKYLGFQIGPDRCHHSWDTPAEKFSSRLKSWPWSEIGLHHAIGIYNAYILSVLAFIAQLEHPPETIKHLEQRAIYDLAPGAGDWIAAPDLHHGREWGLASQLRPLSITCRGAMIRTFARECEDEPRYWENLVVALRRAKTSSSYWDRLRAWAGWLGSHHPTVLHETATSEDTLALTLETATRALARLPTGPLSPQERQRGRAGYQAWVVRSLLANDGYVHEDRVRGRQLRWKLAGIEKHAARRAVRNLRRLRHAVPPRVAAGTVSTLLNRWTTDTRMRKIRQGVNHCLLGCCCKLSDNIEHYLRCPIIHAWLRSRLGCTPPPRDGPLDEWMLARPMSRLRLQMLSLSMYITYRLTNHLRHRGCPASPEYIKRYMNQMLTESVRDDRKLRAALGRARAAAFSCNPRKRRGPRTPSAG